MDDSTEKLLQSSSMTSSLNHPHNSEGIVNLYINPAVVDDDISNYFARLSPRTLEQLDDFVQVTDHTKAPSFNFSFDTSSSTKYFIKSGLQRPVTMYEQSYVQEYSSLPPDVISNSVTCQLPDPNVNRYAWEAEDADYIQTLDESREVYDAFNYGGSIYSPNLVASTQNHYETVQQQEMQW